MDEWESNVEPFTAENVARRLVMKYGDQASIQAALNADHFYAHNDPQTAKIWHDAMKLIDKLPREVRGTVN